MKKSKHRKIKQKTELEQNNRKLREAANQLGLLI